MTRYLLDTSILSALVRHPHGPVATHIGRVGQDRVFTSIIVACEARFGVAKKGSASLAGNLESVLGAMSVLPFDVDADAHYARLRVELERRGRVIGAADMLIAAHALCLDATLVTDNVREFKRVSGLTVRNWLR